jgi:hypothetical protein
MDRKVLLLRLAQAEQSVAESKAFVARQQELIVESERDGQDLPRPFACGTSCFCSSKRASKSAPRFSTRFLRCLDGERHQS